MKKALFYLSILFISASCAYSIHEVQVSDYTPPYAPLERSGDVIKASSEQFTIMGFIQNTNYVDEAYQKIQTQCPNHEISGLTTIYTTDLGFFSWTNRISIQGICRTSSSTL